MIIHAHEEKGIGLVTTADLLLLRRPCKAMTMNRTLIVVGTETTCIDTIGIWRLVKFVVAQIGVICNILVNTVGIIWCMTIAIIIIGLSVARPTALGGMRCTNGWIKLW